MGRFRDGGGAVSDDDDLDPGFAERFQRDDTREPCQLYLVSPLDVSGGFAERLARALDAGPVAAFQFRVKQDRKSGGEGKSGVVRVDLGGRRIITKKKNKAKKK